MRGKKRFLGFMWCFVTKCNHFTSKDDKVEISSFTQAGRQAGRQEGRQAGRQEGRQAGRQEGKQAG